MSNETWYKIFIGLTLFVFIDIIVLARLLQIPFFEVGVLYPVADFVFAESTAFTILGLYSYSWVIFGIMAIASKPKKSNLDNNSDKSADKKVQSKRVNKKMKYEFGV